MKKMFIKINGISDVATFVANAIKVEDGDVIVSSGKYSVDGKSLMGVFSLSLREGVTVEYPETAVEFENYIKNFKAD